MADAEYTVENVIAEFKARHLRMFDGSDPVQDSRYPLPAIGHASESILTYFILQYAERMEEDRKKALNALKTLTDVRYGVIHAQHDDWDNALKVVEELRDRG